MKIYVGNLSWNITEEQLNEMFSEFGKVVSVTIIKDNYTKRSKGFGFIEMENKADANNAISDLNGKEVDGRKLTVNEAKPKTDKPSFGSRERFRR